MGHPRNIRATAFSRAWSSGREKRIPQHQRSNVMRIQIASDLHLEGRPGHMPDKAVFRPVHGRDLLVLAGDIGVVTLGWAFVERELEVSPVVYVPGNHEYYARAGRADVDAKRRSVISRRLAAQRIRTERA